MRSVFVLCVFIILIKTAGMNTAWVNQEIGILLENLNLFHFNKKIGPPVSLRTV